MMPSSSSSPSPWRSAIAVAVVVAAGCAGLASCTDAPAPASNPHVLYLAPGASELQVRLVDTQPPPF